MIFQTSLLHIRLLKFQTECLFPPPVSGLASFLTDLHPFSELVSGVYSCTVLSLPLILVW